MSTDAEYRDPIDELRYALHMGEAEAPPAGLHSRMMATALGRRPARRPVDEAPAIPPLEGYRLAVVSLDALLGQLYQGDWRMGTIRKLDVQGLIGHLIGVEHHFHLALGLGNNGAIPPRDHITSTDPVAAAQAGRPVAATREEWRALTDRTLERLWAAGEAEGDREVELHGVRLPLGAMLTVRAFEIWIHEEDIRRATQRPLMAPGGSSLQLMTGLALSLLPAAMAIAGHGGEVGTARVVLTGPGGRVWEHSFGATGGSTIDVRVVADAVSFCRLVANRLDPDSFPADVSGDHALARAMFAGARALALD